MVRHLVLKGRRVFISADGTLRFGYRESPLPPSDPHWWLDVLDDALGQRDAAPDYFAPARGRNAPTLGTLQKPPGWLWCCCRNSYDCRHKVPIAIAPFVIRWGSDASSDLLRERFRCSRCGHRGADLSAPSWIDNEVGWAPFPGAPGQAG